MTLGATGDVPTPEGRWSCGKSMDGKGPEKSASQVEQVQ